MVDVLEPLWPEPGPVVHRIKRQVMTRYGAGEGHATSTAQHIKIDLVRALVVAVLPNYVVDSDRTKFNSLCRISHGRAHRGEASFETVLVKLCTASCAGTTEGLLNPPCLG